jgi:hypothetical protein
MFFKKKYNLHLNKMNTRRNPKTLQQELQLRNTQLVKLQQEKKKLLMVLYKIKAGELQKRQNPERGEDSSLEEGDQKEIIQLNQRLITVKSKWKEDVNNLSLQNNTLRKENEELRKKLQDLQNRTAIKQRVLQKIPIQKVPVQRSQISMGPETMAKKPSRYRTKRARRIAKLRGLI